MTLPIRVRNEAEFLALQNIDEQSEDRIIEWLQEAGVLPLRADMTEEVKGMLSRDLAKLREEKQWVLHSPQTLATSFVPEADFDIDWVPVEAAALDALEEEFAPSVNLSAAVREQGEFRTVEDWEYLNPDNGEWVIAKGEDQARDMAERYDTLARTRTSTVASTPWKTFTTK